MSTRELFPGVTDPAAAICIVAELLNAYGIAAAGDHHAAVMNLKREGLAPPPHVQVDAYCRSSIMAIVVSLATRESAPAMDGAALPWWADPEYGEDDWSLRAGCLELAVVRYGEQWDWAVWPGTRDGDDLDSGTAESEQAAKQAAVDAARRLLDKSRTALDGEAAQS